MIAYYLLGALFVLAFAGVDVWLALDGVRGNTWSELGRHVAKETPILGWAVGMLAGHIFHPEWYGKAHAANLGALLCVASAVIVVGPVLKTCGLPLPVWAPLIIGFVCGWLLWPV